MIVQYEQQATYRDPESLEEVPLVPGMSKTENMLRWGFIKKVIDRVTMTELRKMSSNESQLLSSCAAPLLVTLQHVHLDCCLSKHS